MTEHLEEYLWAVNNLTVRSAVHSSVNNLEEFSPSHIVARNTICSCALNLLGSADNSFTNLTNGKHSCTACRIHSKRHFFKSLKLLDKDNPNRPSARLSAENIRKFKNCYAHIVIGILESNLFLLNTRTDIRVLIAKFHIRSLLSKPSEIRTENYASFNAALLCHF